MSPYVVRPSDGPLSWHLEDYPDGIVLPVDKPYRWTSADVIRKLKYLATRHFGKKNLKVGHAGTLDPLATGMLIVCIGPATKMAQHLQDRDKEYIAGLSFGATTPSYDLEKAPDRFFPTENVSEEALQAVLPRFVGEQEQVAPLFSAKSVDGVRAYEMARKLYRHGGALDEAAESLLHRATITIHAIELLQFSPDGSRKLLADTLIDDKVQRIHVADTTELNLPRADLRITCSKGTYIRALARDIGEALGTGAFLDSLRRTKSGTLDNPVPLQEALQLFLL